MGSIINRDGRWRALIRRKGFATQCRTFASQAEAKAWVRRTEATMDGATVPARSAEVTVGELVRAYRKLRDKARPISDSSTEHYQLQTLERLLGRYVAARLTPDDLVGFASARKDEGAGPYTVNMDVSKLGTVCRYAAASLRISLPDIVGSARPLLTHLRQLGQPARKLGAFAGLLRQVGLGLGVGAHADGAVRAQQGVPGGGVCGAHGAVLSECDMANVPHFEHVADHRPSSARRVADPSPHSRHANLNSLTASAASCSALAALRAALALA